MCVCGNHFERLAKEYKRSSSLRRASFCSEECAYKHQKRGLSEGFSQFTFVFRTIKRNAISRNKLFDLQIEDLKTIWDQQNGKCPYTGWDLQLRVSQTKSSKNMFQASLDRIDSKKGYTKDNVHFVCLIANYAKHTFDERDMIAFCNAVAQNNYLEPEDIF